MNKLRYFWEKLNSSFWFVPMVIVTAAIAIAIGMISLDHIVRFTPKGIFGYFFTGSADSARSILATIAGAMIGVAGTVFSITLVALTLATSQFGPRLLRNFMYDRVNQVVLGTYVATFVYCLIILNTVVATEIVEFVPVLSVYLAILVAVLNIVLLIIFIHHIAISIQSDYVIARISESLSGNLKKLYPETAEDQHPAPESPDLEVQKQSYTVNALIYTRSSGYLQSVDYDRLLRLAKEHNLLLSVDYRAGDYLVGGLKLCVIWAMEACSDELLARIRNAFIIGNVRTQFQDAEFAIHQMVEIACRALSPGVNDPYTAVACIDNLTTSMCYLTGVHFRLPYWYDEDGKLRLVIDTLDFNGMLDAAFNQIRQFAEGSPSVVIRLMESMLAVAEVAPKDSQLEAIRRHADMLMRTGERSFPEENDVNDLRSRYKVLAERFE